MITRNSTLRTTLWVVAVLILGCQTALAQSETAQKQQSLYDRLGGLAPVSVVVSDFIDALVPDPILNENPAIDAARKRVPAPYLKYHVTAMVCEATGGPCRYHGRGMKESHTHLNITEREWDRMVALFKEVLARHNVPAGETQELLNIIDSTRPDIVASR
ncbi:MAG TPA: group 1 truncated hemoglobin [Desulfobulbaceae bacterium]|nr:group 1 truncated hemoglobin [Desulfobulbaceae bacterium]